MAAGTTAWKWVPIIGAIVGAIVVGGGVLYSVFQGFYTTQQNSAGLADLNARFERLSARVAANEASGRAVQRDLNEIETQFCAEAALRNLTHSTDLRTFADLYEEVKKRPYPIGAPYYATPRGCSGALPR